MHNRTVRTSSRRALRCERLEERLAPAYYAVPEASQRLSSIGIPDHAYVAPTGPTYYVAPGAAGGPSTNPNAPGSAKLTLRSALPDGATVVFADGEYRDVPNHNRYGTNLTADRLTLQAAPGAKPWVLGSKVAAGWSAATTVTINNVSTPLSYAGQGANPWFRTFHAENDYAPYFSDTDEVDPNRPTSQLLDMVFVDRLSLKQVLDNPTTAAREGNEWFGPGKFWMGVVDGELRVYVGADPAGKQVEVTAHGRGLVTYGDAPGLTVRGMGFAHFAFTPIDARSSGTRVESSTFAWNGMDGLYLDGQIQGHSAADAVIRNNRFVGNGHAGVLALRTDRGVIEGNTAAYNNAEAFKTNWSVAGMKFARASDMTIRDNVFEKNFATGLWLDINMFRNDVVRNLVRDNTNQGIFVEISHDNVVAFNLVVRNGTGVLISGASGTRVYNNTLVDNGRAIRVMEDTRTQYTGPEAAAGATFDSYDNTIVNNLLIGANGANVPIADFGNPAYFGPSQPTLQVVRDGQTQTVAFNSAEFLKVLDWNVYYDTSSPLPPVVTWDPTAAQGGVVSYATLDAFRAALPAYEAHGRFLDPLFALTGTTEWEKYTLLVSSPATGVVGVVPADILAAAGLSAQPRYLGAVAPPNLAPTGIGLSNLALPENAAPGTLVGVLSAADPNAGDSFTYALTEGYGNNGRYQIVGDELRVRYASDFEANPNQYVEVTATDSGGRTVTRQFTLALANVNESPFDLTLNGVSVAEDRPAGTVVGALSATDPDAGDTLSYALVGGEGSNDNGSFAISNGQLVTAAGFDFESKASYTVRVRVTDADGLSVERVFTIAVTNVNELPANVALSNQTVAENAGGAAGVVGTLSATDPDGDALTYELVENASNNWRFEIVGNQLRVRAAYPINFETNPSQWVKIRVKDGNGGEVIVDYRITVLNVNEAPTNVTLSNASVARSQPAGTAVGTLTGTDPDAGSTLTYSLVSGTGSTDNASFRIVNNQLQTNAPLAPKAGGYSIRVRVMDVNGLWYEKAFVITVV